MKSKIKKYLLTTFFIIFCLLIIISGLIAFLFLPTDIINKIFFRYEINKVFKFNNYEDNKIIDETFSNPKYLNDTQIVCIWRYENLNKASSNYLVLYDKNGKMEILDNDIDHTFYDVSHNKKYIIYKKYWTSSDKGLYIYNIKEKRREKIAELDLVNFFWDKNDEYIIFLTCCFEIFKINVKSKEIIKIFSSKENIYINDVNEENHIIISLYSSKRMLIIDLSGNLIKVIEPYGGLADDGEILANFQFSPNYRFIAFRSFPFNLLKLYHIKKDKTFIIYILNWDFFDKFTWSPDSKKLYFIQKDKSGNYCLYELKIPERILK
ncbi:MAG: hypothetical protein PHV06_05645 [bacterium]|nr:hypothetical protein [bacterium]